MSFRSKIMIQRRPLHPCYYAWRSTPLGKPYMRASCAKPKWFAMTGQQASYTAAAAFDNGPFGSVERQPNLPDQDLFHYTRGRFVANEQHEMSQRYVRFDVQELAQVAIKALGATSCTHIDKYPDGMHNKTLLLTLDNGTQVVAKIPNPNAGRPHETTASEVATMAFARKYLQTPVPQVFAWSSRSRSNPVGAEYIIMEKMPGVQLNAKWIEMPIEDRLNIVRSLARYQKAWMSISPTQIGSLYFSKDLGEQAQKLSFHDGNGNLLGDPDFAVGPTTGRHFNDDGRSTVNFDRGPWKSAEAYEAAIGQRDIASVLSLPNIPRSSLTLRGPGTHQPTKEKKLRALNYYLAIMKYLLPTDASIRRPCLWHTDLHIENIFVDSANPTSIIGIIDWQSTEVLPLFENARQPYLLDHGGPSLAGLQRPQLPGNLAKLDDVAQREANSLYLNQALEALYKTLLHKHIPILYAAMEFQDTPSFWFLSLAKNLLVDGEAHFLAELLSLEESWAQLPGVRAHGSPPFPIQWSAGERREIEDDLQGALRGQKAMSDIHNALGDLFPEKWLVRHDQYDTAHKALWRAKQSIIQTYACAESDREAWDNTWPFDECPPHLRRALEESGI